MIFTEDGIPDMIEHVGVYQGGEVQVVLDDLTFCIYRRQTPELKFSYYVAPSSEMNGPSGRKKVTRLSFNKRPNGMRELDLPIFLGELNVQLKGNDGVDEAWLVNTKTSCQTNIDVGRFLEEEA